VGVEPGTMHLAQMLDRNVKEMIENKIEMIENRKDGK